MTDEQFLKAQAAIKEIKNNDLDRLTECLFKAMNKMTEQDLRANLNVAIFILDKMRNTITGIVAQNDIKHNKNL